MPAPLCFSALNKILRSGNVTKEEACNVLNEHKDALFRATTVKQRSEDTVHGSAEIKYRPASAITLRCPSPSLSELQCVETIEKGIGVSRGEAALLLRDYLIELKGSEAADLLEHCRDFEAIAPLAAVEEFWGREKRNAFSCVVTLCSGASQSSRHIYHEIFSKFLTENKGAVKDCVLNGASAVISSHLKESNVLSSELFSDVEGWWVMEVFFSYCLFNPLSPEEKESMLRQYLVLARQSEAIYGAKEKLPGPHFDGREMSALFVAALNLSNGLIFAVKAENDLNEAGNDLRHPEKDPFLLENEGAVQRLNQVMDDIASSKSSESVVLSFSWASFLRLRRWMAGTETAQREGDSSQDALRHMSSAVSNNVFGVLRTFVWSELEIDDLISGDLFTCFWVDVIAFLMAFPPQNFSPAQVQEVVDLATKIVRRSGQETWKEYAESLWDRENMETETIGVNSLLRLASGVYPQTFRPLISLLTCFSMSQNSAGRAAEYLQTRLISLTECSESYQESILVLDQTEATELYSSLSHGRGVHFERVFRNLEAVKPGEEEIVFVQSSVALQPNAYRQTIPKGSLGVANSSLSMVTWITSWDGLGAADHILHILLDRLRDHEASMRYNDDVLSELLLSALECLKLLDRLCRKGSKALRDNLLDGTDRLSVVSRIVAELADPGDWINGSWLTRKRRELLLTASSSCISSMTTGSSGRARSILDFICSSKNSLPLHASLSSLGASAFPAVAAISRIAGLCSHSEHLRSDFGRKLSSVSKSDGYMFTANAMDSYRSGADMVYNFLRAVALPLWLTTSVRDPNQESKSLHWLLPACSLQLFSKRPNDVIGDPAIASTLVSVITGAALAGIVKDNETADTFLFPALRASLLACYEALRNRNGSLFDFRQREVLELPPSSDHDSEQKQGILSLTALEKLLIKPDVIQALAVLSSGGSERLQSASFFSAWSNSEFRSFLPACDSDQYLFLNATKDDALEESVRSWRVWVEDMSARCLSLLFCCLSQLAKDGDIIQVPWPTMNRTRFGYWRGGGEWIRNGYAERISSGSVASTELMVAILSCGQRAAARSLMGPRPRKAVDDVSSETAASFGAGVPTTLEKDSRGESKDASARAVDNKCETKNEILSAVVHSLRECLDSWNSKLMEMDCAEDKDGSSFLVVLGQIARSIGTRVRFLRVGRDSHCSSWFKRFWEEHDVWKLLACLLRCDNSKLEGKGDLNRALDPENDIFLLFMSEQWSELSLGSLSIDSVLRKQSVAVDIVATWKAVASDCLHVFASEISLRSSESLVAPQPEGDPHAEQNTTSVSLDVFKGKPFSQFASVFTERWMHLLLSVDADYLREWNCCNPSIGGYEQNATKRISADVLGGRDVGSVEQRTRILSIMLGNAFGLDQLEAEKSRLLFEFRRAGDIRIRYGSDYAFDVPAILSFMRACDVDVASYFELLMDILRLNVELCRKEVQVEVVNSFSAMASAALFADSFAPKHSVALTYSSPQFGGKLCRFLARVLVCISPAMQLSRHSVAIVSEVAKLSASLSANLSKDEKDHPPLTSVRFTNNPSVLERECSLSPLGQICMCMKRILSGVQRGSYDNALDSLRLDSVQWLLLTASHLASSVSFRSSLDVAELGSVAIMALQCPGAMPSLYSAASVAISAVLDNKSELQIEALFDSRCIADIFAGIASLAKLSKTNMYTSSACRSAASLLLNVAQIHLLSGEGDSSRETCIFRHLSGGSVLAFLPRSSETIPTYDSNVEDRSAAHLLWCACLHLSNVIMPQESQHSSTLVNEEGLRGVMEFCTTNLERISRDSLDLSGDWPTVAFSDLEGSMEGTGSTHFAKHLTIGRVEEAEAAAVSLFGMSVYSLQLRDVLPALMQKTVAELVRFTYQVYRLIRAEPVERWVRPVTRRERDRSQLLRSDRDNSAQVSLNGLNPAPWSASPSKQGITGSGTPARRSPSQALRAAVGGSSNVGFRPRNSFLPPSPGMPPTPQQSPLTPGPGSFGTSLSSPGSPWGPYGAGLITTNGKHFGEEVSTSLLRGLWFALASLRRFADTLDLLLFKPSMMLGEDSVGIGVLVAIQYHACNEVCRGADEERRDSLLMIVDNTLYLTITHVTAYNEQGVLTQAVRDELWKRIGTVRSRLRKIVPPCPPYSMVHSRELELFLRQLKGAG